MRRTFFFVSAISIVAGSWALSAKPEPVEGGAPIFRVFASGSIHGGSSSPINIAGKPPLMVVSAVSNVQLSRDRKAVRVVLTPSDARKFADITRKHVHE